MSKLPKLYTNTFNEKIDKSIDFIKINNVNERILSKLEIKKKIDNIFKSKNFIYKIKVKINLNQDTIIEYIIGKKNDFLITIDNKLINITDIKNIEIAE